MLHPSHLAEHGSFSLTDQTLKFPLNTPVFGGLNDQQHKPLHKPAEVPPGPARPHPQTQLQTFTPLLVRNLFLIASLN